MIKYPILFSEDATDAGTIGKIGEGVLAETISCTVTEELNGAFECEMTYPIGGTHYETLKVQKIISVSPNLGENPEPFRIYKISRPINGVVTIYAEHISYDLNKSVVFPFDAASLSIALNKIGSADFSASGSVSPFTFTTDKTSSAAFSSATPCAIRTLLGGSEGSILDVYGGEYRFRGYDVRLMSRRGKDLNLTLRYGKNLLSITKDESSAGLYTHVCPFWYKTNDDTSQLVTLSEKIIAYDESATISDAEKRIYALDLSDGFDESDIPTGTPTQAQLRALAKTWMSKNSSMFSTVISLSVDWTQLNTFEEYKDLYEPNVSLGDSVLIYYPEQDVYTRLRATKTVYDPLLQRYDSITLGTVATTAADTIASNSKAISEKAAKEKKQIVPVAKGGTGVTNLNALKNALNLYVQSGRTDAVSAAANAVTTFEVTFEKPYKTRPIINHSIYRSSMTNAAFGRVFSYMNPVQSHGQYTGVKFYLANNYTSPLNIRVYWDAIGEVVL